MITVRYFAAIREAVGIADETLELPAGVATVGELLSELAARHPGLAAAAEGSQPLLAAVDQSVSDLEHSLAGDEEVAFFPPMTGG